MAAAGAETAEAATAPGAAAMGEGVVAPAEVEMGRVATATVVLEKGMMGAEMATVGVKGSAGMTVTAEATMHQ